MPLLAADSPEVLVRVNEALPLVDMLARQLRRQLGGGVEYDDLASAGREGLLSSARSFDPAHGVPYRRWANLRIKGAMYDALRTQSALPRRIYERVRTLEAGERVTETAAEETGSVATPAESADDKLASYLAGIATAMAIGLLAESGGPSAEDAKDSKASAEDQLAHADLLAKIRAACERRPDAERQLLVRHYFDGVTFEEVAKELGLSKSWASRLHTRAIAGVTKDLKRAGIRDE
ncbi:FliA/WhiG family RNA polymerase sigma factor [soil metagenome]